MAPTPRNILSTLTILIIGTLQVRTMWRIDGESGGLGSFLVVVGWIISISIVVAHVWKWERTKETTPFNPIPLWMFLASAVLSLAACWYRDYRLYCPDRYKVQSHQRQTGKPDRLNLKMNGSYIAEMNEMEWGYRQSGSYSIHHDTVRLDRPLYSDRDELIFHELYIWSTDQHHLIPLENNQLSGDSAKWLEVGD